MNILLRLIIIYSKNNSDETKSLKSLNENLKSFEKVFNSSVNPFSIEFEAIEKKLVS